MSSPHSAFAALTELHPVSFEEASERFHLEAADEPPPEGFNIAVSDALGEDPEEVFLHEGDVRTEGDVTISIVGDDAGMFIIDGDLDVPGILSLEQVDGGSILLVTGTLRAKTVALSGSAQLWIGKDVQVSDYILSDLDDAGGLAAKGEGQAKALVATDRGSVLFGKKPKMELVATSDDQIDDELGEVLQAEEALVASLADANHADLLAAVRAGSPLLR